MKATDIPYFRSIIEREVIFIRKELLGLDRKYWTDVPVYQKYRFCNVHRCYDKTFRLINELDLLLTDINRPLHPGLRTVLRWSASNSLIQWLIGNLRYKTSVANAIVEANKGQPENLFASILDAYNDNIISLVSGSFIVKRYGNDFEEMCLYYKAGTEFYQEFIEPFLKEGKKRTSKDAVKFFKDHAPWCADFGAYCIVSDWLYIEPDLWLDKYTWTAYGPGAFRGINLIISTPKTKYLHNLTLLREEWLKYANEMLTEIILETTGLSVNALDNLCIKRGFLPISKLLTEPLMLDVEHWLCEYAKYMRGWARKKY